MEQVMTFLKDEEGATAVEYGIMVAAIAVAILVVVFALGDQITAMFAEVNEAIDERTGN